MSQVISAHVDQAASEIVNETVESKPEEIKDSNSVE